MYVDASTQVIIVGDAEGVVALNVRLHVPDAIKAAGMNVQLLKEALDNNEFVESSEQACMASLFRTMTRKEYVVTPLLLYTSPHSIAHHPTAQHNTTQHTTPHTSLYYSSLLPD